MVFFELRRINDPMDKAVITRQLRSGLKKFFALRGGRNNPEYIELSGVITNFLENF